MRQIRIFLLIALIAVIPASASVSAAQNPATSTGDVYRQICPTCEAEQALVDQLLTEYNQITAEIAELEALAAAIQARLESPRLTPEYRERLEQLLLQTQQQLATLQAREAELIVELQAALAALQACQQAREQCCTGPSGLGDPTCLPYLTP